MAKAKILAIKYKDWFINQKYIPVEGDANYEEFWEKERALCIDGFTIDGVYFPGTLYYHLNHWKAEVDYEDNLGRLQQKYVAPTFRDTEWMIFQAINKAEKERKGIAIAGSRRLSKSTTLSSYLSHGMTFDQNSQNVLVGLSSDDIRVTAAKIDKGINTLPEEWKWQRIEDNWKSQVTFGIKKKDGTRLPFSTLMLKNLDGGNNQEIIAGTKPRKLVVEEAGKGSFLKGLQAAIPGFNTPYGWICSPVVIFTGGDMTAFQDAKELFFSPEAYNFISFPDEDNPNRKHGLFLGAEYRMEAKYETTLDKYLNIESTELAKIKIQVSDKEKAFKITDEVLELRRKSNDRSAYLKEKMYYPKKVDDIFLNLSSSIFNIDALKAQQIRLKTNEIRGTYVELYDDGDGVKHRISKKIPISNYPVKPDEDKDAPIVVYEFPMQDKPWGLYTAGIDSYRMGQSAYSESLGSVVIFKRMHDLYSGSFQDMVVATYAARPDNKDDWNEQARMLLKWYNAIALVENDEVSFIDYMIGKNEGHYLADQPEWIKEIQVNTTVKRKKGIHRSSQNIRDYCHTTYKAYLDAILDVENDEHGVPIRTTLGCSRILDPMILEETIQYDEDKNADRLIAVELAILLAMKLNPIYGVLNNNGNDIMNAIHNKSKENRGNKLFTNNNSLFSSGRRKRRLF